MSRRILLALSLAFLAAAPVAAQQQAAPARASRVTVSFDGATIHEMLAFFARYSGRSIVAGTGVTGTVSATIHDQPWDEALRALLTANGFAARELQSGIIVVENAGASAEPPGRLVTRMFRLNYLRAGELEAAVRTMLSPRGTVATVPSINALVVTDEERVLRQVAAIVGQG